MGRRRTAAGKPALRASPARIQGSRSGKRTPRSASHQPRQQAVQEPADRSLPCLPAIPAQNAATKRAPANATPSRRKKACTSPWLFSSSISVLCPRRGPRALLKPPCSIIEPGPRCQRNPHRRHGQNRPFRVYRRNLCGFASLWVCVVVGRGSIRERAFWTPEAEVWVAWALRARRALHGRAFR